MRSGSKKIKQMGLGVVPSDRAESVRLMERLRADAVKIAAHFNLKYKSLKAEKTGVTGHYGICYSDGEIRIRLRDARTGRPLKYSSLVNTLIHELAHLKYFDHGDEFKALYFKMLRWAKEQGIYRPSSQTKINSNISVTEPEKEKRLPPAACQMHLF